MPSPLVGPSTPVGLATIIVDVGLSPWTCLEIGSTCDDTRPPQVGSPTEPQTGVIDRPVAVGRRVRQRGYYVFDAVGATQIERIL
jgi:hypothetical protein